jgi:hypothetical protein
MGILQAATRHHPLSFPASRANGVMSHTGHANLSARVDDDKMLLTVEGQVRALRPGRPEAGGIIHTRCPGLLAFAMAARRG